MWNNFALRKNIFDLLFIIAVIGIVFLLTFHNLEGFIHYIQKGDRFLGDFLTSYYQESQIIFVTKRAMRQFFYSATIAGLFGTLSLISAESAMKVWIFVMLIFSIAGAFAVRELLKTFGFSQRWFYVYLLLYYTHYCFWINLFFGQVDEILYAFFVLFLLFLRKNRYLLASQAIALIMSTKYYYVVLLAPLLKRRYWPLFSGAALCSAMGLFVIPLLWMHPFEVFQYYHDVFDNVTYHTKYFLIDTSNQSLQAFFMQNFGALNRPNIFLSQAFLGLWLFAFLISMRTSLTHLDANSRLLLLGFTTIPFVFSATGWTTYYISSLLLTFVVLRDLADAPKWLIFSAYITSLLYLGLNNVPLVNIYYRYFGYHDLFFKLAEYRLYILHVLSLSVYWVLHYALISFAPKHETA